MPGRILEYVQRGLIATIGVVLAFAVWIAFHGVLEGSAAGATTTTLVASGTGPPDGSTTTLPTTDSTLPGGATTTTAPPRAFVPPWSEGSCVEERPPEAENQTILRVYYTCGTPESPTATTFVYRRVPATSRVLTNTFRQLVRGPNNNERDLGFGSFFQDTVAIDSVSLREGRAVIDFTGLDSIAGKFTTQDAVQFFLANLGANAFQFSSVQAVEYRSNGNCTAFWEILGRTSCVVTSRNEWLATVEPNR